MKIHAAHNVFCGGDFAATGLFYKRILCSITATHTYTLYTHTHTNAQHKSAPCIPERLQVQGCQGLLEVWLIHLNGVRLHCMSSCTCVRTVRWVHVVRVFRHFTQVLSGGEDELLGEKYLCLYQFIHLAASPPPPPLPPYISHKHSLFKCKHRDITGICRNAQYTKMLKLVHIGPFSHLNKHFEAYSSIKKTTLLLYGSAATTLVHSSERAKWWDAKLLSNTNRNRKCSPNYIFWANQSYKQQLKCKRIHPLNKTLLIFPVSTV